MNRTETYAALGRLIAVVEAAGVLTPSALGNCLTAPKTQLLGLHLARAIPRLRRVPELDALAAEIMDELSLADVESLPNSVPLTEQGVMQIAYYQQRSKLPAARVAAKAPAGVDWSVVDWERSNADLARDLGVSAEAVRTARKRHT